MRYRKRSKQEIEGLEDKVRKDPAVSRLLNHASWRFAAEAAIDEMLHNKKCEIPTWKTSSTWKQVKAVIEKIVD